tara:strand:+ start:3706 stop:4032 length:327 start_codon:yes stop_codon:yes gene_type:complete
MSTINEILQAGNATAQIQRMTDSELKLLNSFICSEMNYRKGNRIAAAKAILKVGDSVTVNHKRLMYAESLYIVKMKSTKAVIADPANIDPLGQAAQYDVPLSMITKKA